MKSGTNILDVNELFCYGLCMARPFSPWGYKIDYARDIANEKKGVESMTAALENGWFISEEWEAEHFSVNLAQMAVLDEKVANTLGLSLEDRQCLDYYMEMGQFNTEPSGAAYRWGKALADECERTFPDLLVTKEKTKSWLKLYKTRLSRHLRNQKKFG